MAAGHSWENRAHNWERAAFHVPEGAPDLWGDPDSDSDLDEAYVASSYADEFVSLMLNLLCTRTLNCKQFCVLMYWAGKAGITSANKYGFRPDASSGHYSRHLDPILKFKSHNETLYEIGVAGLNKAELSRVVLQIPVAPPHEALPYDAASEVGFRTKLREAITSNSLPPCYYKHPVVTGSPGDLVIPIAIYLDFVPYAENDSVLGLWIHNLINDRRYIFAVFRRRTACICGCRSWCSIYGLLTALAWSLRALARGQWPESRHDLLPGRARLWSLFPSRLPRFS